MLNGSVRMDTAKRYNHTLTQFGLLKMWDFLRKKGC